MNGTFSWDALASCPVVGILRGFDREETLAVAGAAARGGLRSIEVTMNTPGAVERIRELRAAVGTSMNVGAGTVTNLATLDAALDAGAEFIVTPIVAPEVIRAAVEHGVPIVPGALTPTEIFAALDAGATMVKVFPASRLGPGYIRDVKAVFSDARLVPTGGIDAANARAWLDAGAEALGVGSPLFARALVDARDWGGVEAAVRAFLEAIAPRVDRGGRGE